MANLKMDEMENIVAEYEKMQIRINPYNVPKHSKQPAIDIRQHFMGLKPVQK
jgi:hypothetical protein